MNKCISCVHIILHLPPLREKVKWHETEAIIWTQYFAPSVSFLYQRETTETRNFFSVSPGASSDIGELIPIQEFK